MNIDQAYDEVWDSLKTLAEKGVKFEVRPSVSRITKNLEDAYVDKLPVSKWSHVTFYVNHDADDCAINQEVERLAKLNIGFDTGGGFGIRDWEIDWSLELLNDELVKQMMIRKGQVADILDSIEDC